MRRQKDFPGKDLQVRNIPRHLLGTFLGFGWNVIRCDHSQKLFVVGKFFRK